MSRLTKSTLDESGTEYWSFFFPRKKAFFRPEITKIDPNKHGGSRKIRPDWDVISQAVLNQAPVPVMRESEDENRRPRIQTGPGPERNAVGEWTESEEFDQLRRRRERGWSIGSLMLEEILVTEGAVNGNCFYLTSDGGGERETEGQR